MSGSYPITISLSYLSQPVTSTAMFELVVSFLLTGLYHWHIHQWSSAIKKISYRHHIIFPHLPPQDPELSPSPASPSRAPVSGGTMVTISGTNLDVGSNHSVTLAGTVCVILNIRWDTRLTEAPTQRIKMQMNKRYKYVTHLNGTKISSRAVPDTSMHKHMCEKAQTCA